MTIHFSSTDSQISLRPVHDSVVIKKDATHGQKSAYRLFVKRALDITLTSLAIPLVLPLVAMLALLVSLDGRNPFYSQPRVGKNGKTFRLWKLRTMVHNADSLLEDYLRNNPSAREEWNATQKLKKDPRITWAGRFLRKSSMDELPQLWNVLTGSMSLVGPRPMMLCQKAEYRGQSYYRLSPGITGLWQVSDRNESMFSKRAEYDDTYEQVMSFKTDVSVLARTVRVVMRGTGY